MSALKLPDLAAQSCSLKLCSDSITLMGFCVLFLGEFLELSLGSVEKHKGCGGNHTIKY